MRRHLAFKDQAPVDEAAEQLLDDEQLFDDVKAILTMEKAGLRVPDEAKKGA